MGHSHCLKAIFFHVFHSNTIHFIMPAGKLMQSSTSCTSMVIVWGCFKGCWAWEMLYRSYSYCETAVFFNGVPTFNFSSSMNKLEVLSAAKARHLLLVLVYRERSAIYTLYKPWSSINSDDFTRHQLDYKRRQPLKASGTDLKNGNTFEICWTATIFSLFFFSEAFREPQSISGNAGWCVWTASICHQRVYTNQGMFPTPINYPLLVVPHYMVSLTVCDDTTYKWMGPVRPAEKWSAPVHIKACWQPTWDLHYVH